jgi:hypothetical protein
MQSLHLRPKPADRVVLNPDNANRPLLSEGEHVPASIYWHHRLRDDVVEAVPAEQPAPPKAAAAKK